MSTIPSTTIRRALKLWEERTGRASENAEYIGLQVQCPHIRKMDGALGTLKECRFLSLAGNKILKISCIDSLKNLRILSLACNNIKKLNGIEPLADTLEELWINSNELEDTKPIESMKALKVLHLANNRIKDWCEFDRLSIPPKLEELTFTGNPVCKQMDESTFRSRAIRKLQNLKTLDGVVIRVD